MTWFQSLICEFLNRRRILNKGFVERRHIYRHYFQWECFGSDLSCWPCLCSLVRYEQREKSPAGESLPRSPCFLSQSGAGLWGLFSSLTLIFFMVIISINISKVTSCLGGGSALGDSQHHVWRPRGLWGLPAGDQDLSEDFSRSSVHCESLFFFFIT